MLCCWHGFCVAGAAEAPFSAFALAPLPTLYSNIASPTTAPQAFLYLLKKFSTALRHARGTFPFLLFFPTSCPFPSAYPCFAYPSLPTFPPFFLFIYPFFVVGSFAFALADLASLFFPSLRRVCLFVARLALRVFQRCLLCAVANMTSSVAPKLKMPMDNRARIGRGIQRKGARQNCSQRKGTLCELPTCVGVTLKQRP